MATTSSTVWAFIGVEGAVVLSARAKRSSDVGKASLTGFIGLLALYVVVAVLSMGVLPAEQLAELKQTSENYNKAVANGNMEDMIKYDTRFHRIIVESCNNKVLVTMIEQLQELVLRFRYIYYDTRMSSSLSCAALQPISGLEPAPRPFVIFSPI